MLYEILKHIRNFFADNDKAIIGYFEIVSGSIDLPFDAGQLYIVEGSAHNDYTVFKYGESTHTDEAFNGTITPICPPNSLIDLCSDIEAWCAENKNKKSAYTSESFGGYSYTKGTTASGRPLGWQEVYADRLSIWRKV